MTPRRPRRAVTLIEAVLFIAIALGLIVGGLVFFQQASLSQRTQEAARLLNAIIAEMRALERRAGLKDGFDWSADNVLVASGAIPSSYVSGNDIEAPWLADDISIMTVFDDSGTTVEEYFTITLEKIPYRLCVRLMTMTPDGVTPFGGDIGRIEISDDEDYDAHLLSQKWRDSYGEGVADFISIGATPAVAAETCESGTGKKAMSR
jgi:type II secretory pathway pseudopilin PulG